MQYTWCFGKHFEKRQLKRLHVAIIQGQTEMLNDGCGLVRS